ncbi:MAG: hypothetical protein ABGY41_23055, partial [Candidatus Poribacteria bacterium]
MRYPQMGYRKTETTLLCELYMFDGTYREVVFRSEANCEAAMKAGRADIDCVAIDAGMLPRGAAVVFAARPIDAKSFVGDGDPGVDPLAATRLAFSLQLLASRSRHIDAERDREARRLRPEDARRYEALA